MCGVCDCPHNSGENSFTLSTGGGGSLHSPPLVAAPPSQKEKCAEAHFFIADVLTF